MTSGTIVVTAEHDHDHDTGAPGAWRRPSWAAVLAGVAATVATWLVLQMLGFGVGLVALDVDTASSWRNTVLGTGIWGLFAPLVAFMVGGLVTGFFAHTQARLGTILHGVLTWSVATIAGLVIVGTVVSSLVSGVAQVGAGTARAAAGAVGSTASAAAANAGGIEDLEKAFGINANDALHPVNQRLRAEGKPTVTADQLELAAKDVVRDAVRAGELDRAMLVQSLADQTALTDADAQEIAARVEDQFDRTKARLDQQLQQAKAAGIKAAQDAVDATGKTMLAIFGALLLGLVSAAVGAMVGGARGWRRVVVVPRRD